jgi:hypothetical protein
MKLARKTYILGGANTSFIGKFHPDFIWKGHAEFGKRDNPTLEDYIRIATTEASSSTTRGTWARSSRRPIPTSSASPSCASRARARAARSP